MSTQESPAGVSMRKGLVLSIASIMLVLLFSLVGILARMASDSAALGAGDGFFAAHLPGSTKPGAPPGGTATAQPTAPPAHPLSPLTVSGHRLKDTAGHVVTLIGADRVRSASSCDLFPDDSPM